MVSYADALKLLSEKALLFKGAVETVPLAFGVGRKTASEIESPANLPATETSACAGYAIRSGETVEASSDHPLKFEILGLLKSDQPALPTKNGVYELAAGDAFPDGFDACVKQDDVVRFGDKITLTMPVSKNQNRRAMGEDFQKGVRVVATGHRIRPEDLVVLKALGVESLQVFRVPRIASTFATPFVACELLETLERAHDFDVVLTHDVTALRGFQSYFKNVNGITFGRLNEGPFVFALAQDSETTVVGHRFFVEPFLKAMKRESLETPRKARLVRALPKHTGPFVKANLRGDVVEAIEDQRALGALLASNAWILLDGHEAEGTLVDVFSF